MTKLDKITKDAEHHMNSVSNSPAAHVEKRIEKSSKKVAENLLIKMNEVDDEPTFKQ